MQTDEQLARDVQRGINSSMNTLIERHYPLLMGYLYRPYTAHTVWGRLIYRW